MARISLLLSFAFALSIGSLLLSLSSHALPVPLIPKTVSELQTLPFAKITEILNHKEKFAPKTAKIKAMFTMCKGYVEYLESVCKSENHIVDVLGIAKTKYALTTKAIFAVQASISGKVDKKTSFQLRKSCAGFTKSFLHIQKAIVKISAKHNYKADANINFRESKQITDAILYFRSSINDFMDLVNDFEEKKMKKVVHHARSLEEDEDVGRAISHGREITEKQAGNNTTEKVNSSDQSSHHDKFFQFFGSFLEGKQHGRELTESQADGKVNNWYEEVAKYMSSLGGKDHGRKLLKDQAGDNDGAQVSGVVKGSLEDFFNFYGNEKVQMDAAGKMKVAGKDGFRSLNRAHYKLFVSKEA
ncbi:hypothetical protein Bca52824_007967 [Brassica carinata]|uniref:Uncharacterized protein n=1 Tax=Brassica carinata TaxID=52824 RepID=A0A8X8B5S3_BRACI|nr:hypothetical protein Bca52824_007967 [Brassica carinata]